MTSPDGWVVALDVGGTKIAAARVDRAGGLGPVLTVATPATAGPRAILDAMAAVVVRAVGEVGGPGSTEPSVALRGIGVGTAGAVDVRTGTIISATNAMPGWAGAKVADGLRARLGESFGDLPIFVENDVEAHAAGESWLGSAAGARSALMVAVGTGVGAAIVLEGRALRGAHHVAGELGHLPAPGAVGLLCPCGRRGHLEAIGSGPGLHRYYLSLGGERTSTGSHDVVARADAGDPVAVRAVADSAAAIGRGIAAVVTVLDPEVVVVGGGMAAAGTLWWNSMEQALRSELIDVLMDVPLLRAQLGSGAALIGAARGAWSMAGTA